MSEAGHNAIDALRLRSFVERVEQLEEEKQALADDIKEVYQEMKSVGFDVKIVRKVVAMRKQDESQRTEAETLLALYCNALGVQMGFDF